VTRPGTGRGTWTFPRSGARVFAIDAMTLASLSKSNSPSIWRPSSSTALVMSNLISNRDRNAASRRICARSERMRGSAFGYWTFTATTWPACSLWAFLAFPALPGACPAPRPGPGRTRSNWSPGTE